MHVYHQSTVNSFSTSERIRTLMNPSKKILETRTKDKGETCKRETGYEEGLFKKLVVIVYNWGWITVFFLLISIIHIVLIITMPL